MNTLVMVETTFDSAEKRAHYLEGISRRYRLKFPNAFRLRFENGRRVLEKLALLHKQTHGRPTPVHEQTNLMTVAKWMPSAV